MRLLRKGGSGPTRLDGGTVQWLIVLIAVVLVLFMSTVTFMNSGLHEAADLLLENLTAFLGMRMGADTIVVLLMIIILLAGAVNEKKLKWSISLAWVLYMPSALYYSKIDWLYILSAGNDFSLLKSGLPDVFIMLNGAALVGTSVLVRSFVELRRLRQGLLDRRGSAPEVDAACAMNLLFLARTVGVSVVSVIVIWGLVALVSSLGGLSALGEAYLWTALAATIMLLAMFIMMIVGRGPEAGKEGAGGP